MKNSTQLSIVVSMAGLVVVGCSSTQGRDCVDKNGKKLPDTMCRSSSGLGYPRYIYGGTQSGSRIVGGSSTPSAASTSRNTTRGGFGGGGSFGG